MPLDLIRRRTAIRRAMPTVLLCGFAFCGALATDVVPLPAPEPLHQIVASSQKLEVRDVSSVVLEFPDWLTRVISHDPAVVHVTAIKPNCLRIIRRTDGQTRLKAHDRKDHEYIVELTVVTSRKADD